jgi:hypothetical protein
VKYNQRGGAAGVICALTFAGCSTLFTPSGPKISVSMAVERPPTVPTVLRADIGGQRVELASTEPGPPRSTDVRGRQYGLVPVRVALLTTDGASLAAVEFSQQFERDRNHWVAARLGQHRPLGHCIGTLVAAPLRQGGADTLFVMYGSLPEGAIC